MSLKCNEQVLLNKLKSKRKRIVRLLLNGDELLEKHLSEGTSNAHYTSRFSARVLIEAIDIWIERKLMCSLQESP